MKHAPFSKAAHSPANVGTSAPQDHAATLFVPPADEIACRAYLNFQNHGSAYGHDVADWLHAEAELIAERQLASAG